MGRKKTATGLGQAIIRDRFGKKNNKVVGDSFLHTSELKDGYDWGRLNLQSVTEQNNLDDFLTTAEMAGKEFTAEKQNVILVTQETGALPKADEVKAIHGLHRQHANLLRIPRRPHWTTEMSASEVDQNEKVAFLDWRRSLAQLESNERIVMTPYEKNLDFWRQLWRVIERSDVVVQIVDARNPLLFYCGDLETYVSEVNLAKVSVLLINKADYLTETQRKTWSEYFTKRGIRIAFWSAVAEASRQEKENNPKEVDDEDIVGKDSDLDSAIEDESEADDDVEGEDGDLESSLENKDETEESESGTKENVEVVSKIQDKTKIKNNEQNINNKDNDNADKNKNSATDSEKNDTNKTDIKIDTVNDIKEDKCDSNIINDNDKCPCGMASERLTENLQNTDISDSACGATQSVKIENTPHVYNGPELLELFRSLHINKETEQSLTTVGMVGYPNVGKSSTINAILKMKKVPVSATPGRTKHFQTLYVDSNLMLCDCPGLVFPSFVTTKADLVVNGILPIDQMRDCLSPTALLCQRIPRWLLESTYGIILPRPGEGEDSNRPPTAYELLNAYGQMRGYMTSRGQPDAPRASRYLLKDYVNGKLLYCHPPPEVDPVGFNDFESREAVKHAHSLEQSCSQPDQNAPIPSKIDTEFFTKNTPVMHQKSSAVGGRLSGQSGGQEMVAGKPWKKHNNKKKKEKLRRVYAHLDK